MNLTDRIDAESGGFNHATGELQPGFAISATDTVLHVGCGDGHASLFCARQGAAIIYADIDAAQVEAAGRNLAGAGARSLQPLVSDSNPLPLPDATASRIICTEVIARVDDPARFLAELARVGAPGALYLLAVPDPAAAHLQRDVAAPGSFQKPNNVRIIGRDEFAAMVTGAGLVVEHRGAYGFYWTIWWMLFQICRVDLADPRHPLLQSWANTWGALLDTPGHQDVVAALNGVLPKSQYIIARKPGATAVRPRSAPAARGAWRGLLRGLRGRLPTPPPAAPLAVLDDIDPLIVGLHDAVQSGWFDGQTRTLYKGFTIRPEDVVLDVGCGGGNYAAACGNWGAAVIFTDIEPANVAATERRVAQTPARASTALVSDANPLPLETNTASRIICMEVLEHVDDPDVILAELARVGQPGALYLLAVPDPVQEALQHRLADPNFFVKPKPGAGSIRGLSSGHLRTIGRQEFEQMVARAGLVVERHDYGGFFWALWFTFFWICNVDFTQPAHPLLASWARTWKLLLDHPDGHRAKAPLDGFMPKSQIILARKPASHRHTSNAV